MAPRGPVNPGDPLLDLRHLRPPTVTTPEHCYVLQPHCVAQKPEGLTPLGQQLAVSHDQGMEGQPPAIDVAKLCKSYGQFRAVENVSFQVRHGEIYALLGPNGAGKTTTVEILEGHRKRTSGSVRVLGFDPGTGGRRFRERLGIVLQSGSVDAELTIRELVAL